jgi:hypothetical protein
MKKMPSRRKGAWFVKLRGSYLPCSWQGWLTYIPYISLVIGGFLPIWSFAQNLTGPGIGLDRGQTVLNATVIGLATLAYEGLLAVAMQWLASRKS